MHFGGLHELALSSDEGLVGTELAAALLYEKFEIRRLLHLQLPELGVGRILFVICAFCIEKCFNSFFDSILAKLDS